MALNIDYDLRFYSGSTSDSRQKSSQIYRAGLTYKINETWSAKTSFNYQTFTSPYYSKIALGYRDQISLRDVKIGIAYNF